MRPSNKLKQQTLECLNWISNSELIDDVARKLSYCSHDECSNLMNTRIMNGTTNLIWFPSQFVPRLSTVRPPTNQRRTTNKPQTNHRRTADFNELRRGNCRGHSGENWSEIGELIDADRYCQLCLVCKKRAPEKKRARSRPTMCLMPTIATNKTANSNLCQASCPANCAMIAELHSAWEETQKRATTPLLFTSTPTSQHNRHKLCVSVCNFVELFFARNQINHH